MPTGWVERLPMFPTMDVEEGVSREVVFDVLRNERRRYALHYLKREGTVDVTAMVEQIAAWEYDTAPEDLTSSQRQRVHVSLLQTHLPMMDDADVIRFDEEARTVELSNATEAIDIYLEVVPADDIAWAEYYLGITLFDALVLVLVWQDVYPFVTLPDVAWGLFVTGLLLLAALVHHWYHRRARLGTGTPPAN